MKKKETSESNTPRQRYYPVKRVMQITYKAHLVDGAVQQGKIIVEHTLHKLNYIATFNEKQIKTEVEQYGSYGKEVSTPSQHDGLPLKKIEYNLDGAIRNITTHKFTPTNQLLETISLDEQGISGHKSFHHYNEKSKSIGSETYHVRNGKDILYEKTVTTYHACGDIESNINYDGNGKVKHQSLMKYNDKGLRTEYKTEWFEKNMLGSNSRTTYVYNDKGDCIETTYYNSDGSVKNIYTHNPQYDSGGKKIVPPHPVYVPPAEPGDEIGQVVNDERGNWIKKTTFDDKKPVRIYTREYIYFDAADDKTLTHPLSDTELVKSDKVKVETHNTHPLEKEEAKWIVETAGNTPDQFPYLRYYTMYHNEPPSVVTFTGPYIEAISLLKELKEHLLAQEIHSYCINSRNGGEQLQRYTLKFASDWGYMLHATGISSADADEYYVPDDFDLDDDERLHFSQFILLRPSDASGHRDEFFEERLEHYMHESSFRKKPDKPVINIIEVSGNSFVMQEHAVKDDFEIRDLDVNYGQGFTQFHTELMHRFNKSSKGLVLFHGEPGTGKTYYIRHLLRRMVSNQKVVIYMPPNMVDHLVEPAFMTFLTGEIKDWSEDGFFCVLLIEDAEPLLAKRQEGVRIQGITNLLNMSDGLLNDMLNLQIICTFNVDVRKLDSALLRPGRLIARKEFKALNELDANLLAQRLGIKHHFTKPATLGEIYALRKHHNTLIHDVSSDKGASSAIDDLL